MPRSQVEIDAALAKQLEQQELYSGLQEPFGHSLDFPGAPVPSRTRRLPSSTSSFTTTSSSSSSSSYRPSFTIADSPPRLRSGRSRSVYSDSASYRSATNNFDANFEDILSNVKAESLALSQRQPAPRQPSREQTLDSDHQLALMLQKRELPEGKLSPSPDRRAHLRDLRAAATTREGPLFVPASASVDDDHQLALRLQERETMPPRRTSRAPLRSVVPPAQVPPSVPSDEEVARQLQARELEESQLTGHLWDDDMPVHIHPRSRPNDFRPPRPLENFQPLSRSSRGLGEFHPARRLEDFQPRHLEDFHPTRRMEAFHPFHFDASPPFLRRHRSPFSLHGHDLDIDSLHGHGQDLDLDSMSYEQLQELQERIGKVKPDGADLQAISTLPTFNHSAELPSEHKQCCICLSDFEGGETLKTLPCIHVFHADCIDRWLQTKNQCPTCQTVATSS